MLIVGTRGRSLGGFQGLVSNRNSFSKWCLQYSPIPVVVVRPTEKRKKKKDKRVADPARQDYARILKESGIEEHETEYGSRSNSIFEVPNDPASEAHAVAAAIGLPAAFDPTLNPILLEGSRPLKKLDSGTSDVTNVSQRSLSPDSGPNSPGMVMKTSKSQQESPTASGDESSDDEEGEFEAVPGHTLLANEEELSEVVRKQRLHEMEVGEAAALMCKIRKKSDSVDSTASAAELADGEDNED
jgi:hypothetical protein